MNRRGLIILYIMMVWFVISFVTNLIGPLMPIIIDDFHLSLGMAGFLPFSFFLAYGLISIPAGALVEARGPRTTIFAAFGLNLLGCLAIALYPVYSMVIAGLFVIGLGMAMLQVVINPLTRATGGARAQSAHHQLLRLHLTARAIPRRIVFRRHHEALWRLWVLCAR
jgi:MFS transporter, FHS family, L-fucose permease